MSSESVNKQIYKARSTSDNPDDSDLTLIKNPIDDASGASTSKDSLQDILSRIQVQNNKSPLIIKEIETNTAGQSSNVADTLPQTSNEVTKVASNTDLEDPSSLHITISPTENAKAAESKIAAKQPTTSLVFGGAFFTNDSIKNLKEDVSKLSSNEAANLAISNAVLSQTGTGKSETNTQPPMITITPNSQFKLDQNLVPTKTLEQNVQKMAELQTTARPLSAAVSDATKVSAIALSPNDSPTVQITDVSSNAVSKLVPNGYNIQDVSGSNSDSNKFYSKENMQPLIGKPGQQVCMKSFYGSFIDSFFRITCK